MQIFLQNLRLVEGEYDDIWMRDMGPIFLKGASAPTIVHFPWKEWGYVGHWSETSSSSLEPSRDAGVAKLCAKDVGGVAVLEGLYYSRHLDCSGPLL